MGDAEVHLVSSLRERRDLTSQLRQLWNRQVDLLMFGDGQSTLI